MIKDLNENQLICDKVVVSELTDATGSRGLGWIEVIADSGPCCIVRTILRKRAYLEKLPKPAV